MLDQRRRASKKKNIKNDAPQSANIESGGSRGCAFRRCINLSINRSNKTSPFYNHAQKTCCQIQSCIFEVFGRTLFMRICPCLRITMVGTSMSPEEVRLLRMWHAEDKLTPGEIAARLWRNKSTLTRLLVKKRKVIRRVCAQTCGRLHACMDLHVHPAFKV